MSSIIRSTTLSWYHHSRFTKSSFSYDDIIDSMKKCDTFLSNNGELVARAAGMLRDN